MRILITGVSGLLGRTLSWYLEAAGHEVIGLSRRRSESGDFWDLDSGVISITSSDSVDAVIHLAGENVAGGRWSTAKKERIMQSRVRGTRLVAEYCAGLKVKPKVIISASGVGYYGETGDEVVDESSVRGNLFLSDVCSAWEIAMMPAEDAGIRVVYARLGMVLSSDGGALSKMLPAFKLGLGGVVGSGRQWMSWVSMRDVLGVFEMLLADEGVGGPVNVASPNPVTNRDFTRELAGAVHRPALVPLPSFLVRLMFGQMGQELLLVSSRVEAGKLNRLGYKYHHADLEDALQDIVDEGVHTP